MSIGVAVLLTAVEWSHSIKTETKDFFSSKREIVNKLTLKGVNKMTVLIAFLLVSVGAPERDSNKKSVNAVDVMKIGRSTLRFDSSHAH